jgi:hypothetical protein
MRIRLKRCEILIEEWQEKKLKDLDINKSELIRKLLTTHFENTEEFLVEKEKKLRTELDRIEKQKDKRDTELKDFYEKNKDKAREVYIQIFNYYEKTYHETGEFISNEQIPILLAEYTRLTGNKQVDVKNKIMDDVKKGIGVYNGI